MERKMILQWFRIVLCGLVLYGVHGAGEVAYGEVIASSRGNFELPVPLGRLSGASFELVSFYFGTLVERGVVYDAEKKPVFVEYSTSGWEGWDGLSFRFAVMGNGDTELREMVIHPSYMGGKASVEGIQSALNRSFGLVATRENLAVSYSDLLRYRQRSRVPKELEGFQVFFRETPVGVKIATLRAGADHVAVSNIGSVYLNLKCLQDASIYIFFR